MVELCSIARRFKIIIWNKKEELFKQIIFIDKEQQMIWPIVVQNKEKQ